MRLAGADRSFARSLGIGKTADRPNAFGASARARDAGGAVCPNATAKGMKPRPCSVCAPTRAHVNAPFARAFRLGSTCLIRASVMFDGVGTVSAGPFCKSFRTIIGKTCKAFARSRRYARLMGLVLTDISAIEAYRRDRAFGSRPVAALPFGKARGLDSVRPRAAELRELDQRGYASLSRPVHVLVPHRDMRIAVDDVTWHVWSGSLPKSGAGFRRGAQEVFLASPELAMLHYASHVDLTESIAVAFELCGTYRLGGPLGFERADPLTSAKRLSWFASGVQGARGVERLRRIAGRVLVGSASPMETALVMLLSMPCTLGGYGLPAPSLNVRIDVSSKNELNQSKRYYVADLYWAEAHFAIEYDSDRWHVGPERIGQDAARRNALLFQGINVVTVCSKQIMSESKMDDIARITARALGRSVRPRVKEWRKRNRELRRVVLPHRVDGLNGYS